MVTKYVVIIMRSTGSQHKYVEQAFQEDGERMQTKLSGGRVLVLVEENVDSNCTGLPVFFFSTDRPRFFHLYLTLHPK